MPTKRKTPKRPATKKRASRALPPLNERTFLALLRKGGACDLGYAEAVARLRVVRRRYRGTSESERVIVMLHDALSEVGDFGVAHPSDVRLGMHWGPSYLKWLGWEIAPEINLSSPAAQENSWQYLRVYVFTAHAIRKALKRKWIR